jgi:fatty acid desaturase
MQLKDDLIFVLFRKLPWTGKLIFKHHWKDTVDEDTYRSNFTPSYNPWEQRIAMAIGLKDTIRNGKLKIITGRIDRFAESGIQLKDGRQLETDLCILATGFDLAFFKFEISIDGRPVDTADINFYKGMMMGGIPNYFQPFVAPHSSFTRRVEVVSRLIVKIIRYMRKHQLDRVSIERKKVEKVPRITPNYVMRNLDRLPAIYGTFELPSIDSLLFFRFRKSNYTFSGRNEATTQILSTRTDFEREVRLGKELKQKLRDAGCFAPARVQQTMHILLVLLAYTGGYALLLTDPPVLIQLATLFTMAVVNVQAGFIAHEAGHGAITRNIRLARFIGRLFNTLLTALAYSHFQYIHTRHHAYCNDRIKDPDIQSNIFSLYPQAVAEKRRAVSRFITRYQHYLIWPLVSLQGFSLKVDSIHTLRRMPECTRVDQVLLLMHLLLWLAVPTYVLGLPTALVNYLLMTWFIGPYLGSVFLVNHIGTHVVEPDESMPVFLQRLITTRNLGDSKIANWYFGGINHHIEHHLFPTIPSARLANARKITRAFCQEHGLPYRETSWLKAIGETMHYLDDVAEIGQALQPAGHQED